VTTVTVVGGAVGFDGVAEDGADEVGPEDSHDRHLQLAGFLVISHDSHNTCFQKS
jgi:hypothetical protein